MGMLAERAGYKELEAIPQYPVDVMLETIDVDRETIDVDRETIDVDTFEPSFIDLEQTPYME